MKQICSYCGEKVVYRAAQNPNHIACPACKRLLFGVCKTFSSLWLLLSVLAGIVTGIFLYRAMEHVYYVWGVYVPIFSGAALVLLLSALRPLALSVFYRMKHR